MKKKRLNESSISHTESNSPKIWVSPDKYLFPYKIQLFGSGWGMCRITLQIDGKELLTQGKFFAGYPGAGGFKPASGSFHLMLTIPGLSKGKHTITALSDNGKKTTAVFDIDRSPALGKDGRPTNRWARRMLHFLQERFPGGINKLPGSRLRALEHRNKMRLRKDKIFLTEKGTASAAEFGPDFTSPPIDPGCNWYSIGPSV